jgi:hypothetical protein
MSLCPRFAGLTPPCNSSLNPWTRTAPVFTRAHPRLRPKFTRTDTARRPPLALSLRNSRPEISQNLRGSGIAPMAFFAQMRRHDEKAIGFGR